MAERLTPGVYIDEPPSAVRPIQGASTSTAGFLGEAERGIPGRATFVRSTSDYQRFFGGPRRGPAGHLSAAVQAFFDAGGRRAYVVRVLPGNATAGASEAVPAADIDPWGIRRDVLRVRAKGNGAWASSLRIHVEPSPSAVGPAFRLRVERIENGRARTLETFDELRMDANHPDYVGVVVNETSQYVEVDDLFSQLFLDAEERTEPPLPDVVAALTSVAPTRADGRFAIPRRAVLQVRWRDSVGQVGSAGSDQGRGVPVVFDDPSTPGTIEGDDVLVTSDELVDWLGSQLGGDFRVLGSQTPARLRSTDGPWDTTGGTASSFTLDGASTDVTYAARTSATLDLGAGPFGVDADDVLELTVGGVTQRHTIAAGEVTGGAATPAEVAAVLNTAFTGIQAFTDPNLRVRTDARGPGASLGLGGATAGAFGSPPTATGGGNVADPAAVTAAELAAAVNALGLPLHADVQGAGVVVRFTDSAPHTLDWTADPGPDDILAGTAAVTSPVPGGPVTLEPAVASRAYAVAVFPGTTLDLSAAGSLSVVATSGALTRTVTIDTATLPNNTAVALGDLAEAISTAADALEATEADRLLVTADAAGSRLVLSAPPRRDGLTLRLQASGTAPWTGVPAVRDGAAGAVVEDQRAVEITLSEPLRAGVARAVPRLFRQARGSGRVENDPGSPVVLPAATGDAPLRLLGGSDGTGAPGLVEFQGALSAFDSVDLGILAAPGKTDGGYVAALSAYADAWDVFYVADGPGSDDRDVELSADDVRRHVEGLPARSRNAGMYYPWVEVPDPVGIGRDPRRFVPPSGHVAGVMARTDTTRGVWKAPAGVEAVVSGAVGLQARLIDRDQDLFNPIGLNCLRQFPTAGIVTWGSRTLATESDPAWRYVPVRRTALFLKESLRRGLQWAVFEPNDEDLWTQITLNVTAFMLSLFRQGAFQGTTPQEAFFVQCDRDTNPQELVDQGIVTTRVAFAPLKPAEFVVVELTQKSLVAV